MHIILLLLIFIALLFGPQWWAKHVLKKHGVYREDFPGTGGELAQHLLKQLKISRVKVEITELGDHYNPLNKTIGLTQDNFNGKSLTAIVTATHEVGHAIQDYIGYPPLQVRSRLTIIAQIAEKVGAGLMFMIPIVTIVMPIPQAGILMFLGGLAALGSSVVVHLVTLPVEWDASFKRALPILIHGQYISSRDRSAAREILTACALTYVATSLASLLNLWRWLAILRR